MARNTGLFILFTIYFFLITGCLIFNPPTGNKPTIILTATSSNQSDQPDLEQPSKKMMKIYLVALEDAGKSGTAIGCGDSLVTVDVDSTDARSALEFLLQQKNHLYGQSGLYNSLYQSDLRVEQFKESAGSIEVDLGGTLTLGGVCDNPRVKAQLEATTRQSMESTLPVTIRINGELLDEVLSLK